jgi:hypothetical protein
VSTIPPIRREVLVDAEEHGGQPGDTFVVLLHRPGPAAPTSGSCLRTRGSEGMTILRLPGAGRFAEATRLATEDDASVAGGFFTVTVRPWQVMMGAG